MMCDFQEKSVDSCLTTKGLSTPKAAKRKLLFFKVPVSSLFHTGLFPR
jgi:hypothetical protein